MAAERVGAAKRRRDRQLRAFRRHELLTVRMELAAALHHSAQRVEAPREVEEHETYVGLRAQMPPPPGTRPAALREPGLQLVVEHAASPCSSWVPLSSPALGGDCSLDRATVSFIVHMAVEAQAELDRRKRREEEEAKKAKEAKESEKQLLERLRAKGRRELVQRLDSGGASSKRKKKKRRRKRLPKASSSRLRRGACSSMSGCCLMGTRFGSWEMTSGSSPKTVLAWFGSGYSTCVSRRCFWFLFHIFLCEGGHRFLDQMDILAVSPWPRSSPTPALTCAWLFYWFAPRVAFPSVLFRPTMLGVTAGMNQKEFFLRGEVLDVPVVWSCRFSVAAVEKPLALPQLQLVEKSVTFSVPLCLHGVRLRSTGFWTLLEMTSGNVCVFSAYWFYTGYMSASVYGGLGVQRYVRVHSSSYGALRDVVHSPSDWLCRRCHCSCRGFVLFVGRRPWLCGFSCESVCVSMSCGGGFIADGTYDSVWDSVLPMTENSPLFPVPVVGLCLHAEWLVQQLRRYLPR